MHSRRTGPISNMKVGSRSRSEQQHSRPVVVTGSSHRVAAMLPGMDLSRATSQDATMANDREQKIRERAHAIWEREGRPDGRQAEHWEQAAREIADEEGEDAGSSDSASRDYGDSAGYGSGGSSLDHRAVGDEGAGPDQPNPLDDVVETGPEQQAQGANRPKRSR